MVDADPAPDRFYGSQPLLPLAVCLAYVMDQAKISGKITGPEILCELPGQRGGPPQMGVQAMAYAIAVHAVRGQHDHDRLRAVVRSMTAR